MEMHFPNHILQPHTHLLLSPEAEEPGPARRSKPELGGCWASKQTRRTKDGQRKSRHVLNPRTASPLPGPFRPACPPQAPGAPPRGEGLFVPSLPCHCLWRQRTGDRSGSSMPVSTLTHSTGDSPRVSAQKAAMGRGQGDSPLLSPAGGLDPQSIRKQLGIHTLAKRSRLASPNVSRMGTICLEFMDQF